MVNTKLIGRVALFTVLGFALFASGASAQESEEDAKALFLRARTAIDEGRFAEARDMLQSSLDKERRVSTGYNLAVALRGTGELNRAIDVLDALLNAEYGEMDDAQQAEVSRLREALLNEVSMLRVLLGKPDVAAASIDGAQAGEIRAGEPRELRLDPGTHRLRLSSPGHIDREETVKLFRGDRRTVEVSLRTSAGVLQVSTSNPANRVEIVDVGRAKGQIKRSLPPGEYLIRAYDGDRIEEREVTLAPGATLRIQLDVPKPPLAKQPWFWVGLGLGAAAIGTGTYFLARPGTRPFQTTDDFGSVIRALPAR